MSESDSANTIATKAVILIGGPSKGTRFRPLSFHVPKPLFPVMNRPLIYHHIKACATKLPGLVEILLMGFFDESQFAEFISETSAELNVTIRYLKEETRLGTAGGFNKFREEIQKGLGAESPVLVLHCDILCSFPLEQLVHFHHQHAKLCTILTKRVPTNTAHNFGCIIVDPETKEVQHYVEKPQSFVSDMVNCGVYVFRMEIFDRIHSIAQTKPVERDIYDIFSFPHPGHSPSSLRKKEDVRIRLELDVFRHIASRKSLYAYETPDFWLQIKHPINSLQGSQTLLSLVKEGENDNAHCSAQIIPDVLVHPSSLVHPTAKLGPNVTIGKNVKIGAGVRVKNSIILDGVEIKDRACVVNSIIGWESVIGQWCRIEGSANQLTIFGQGVTAKPETLIINSIVLPHKELTRSYTNQILL